MNTILFKSKRLTRTKCVNNILRVYDRSLDEHRRDWYQEARNFAVDQIANEIDPTRTLASVRKAIGIVAAFSPMKSWETNKTCALHFVQTGVGKHTKVFTKKANDILASDGRVESIMDILNGNKIQSFFMNILRPDTSDEITIDRHALSVALGGYVDDTMTQGITMTQYEFFVNCYKLAGIKRAVRGTLMQSATWMTFRVNKNDYKRITRDVW